jgi:hypothetical protein
MTTNDWLRDVLLVNDDETETPGDVMLFRNFTDARAYLEHWADEPGIVAFFANGNRLVIATEPNGNVSIARREEQAEGSRVVLNWLRYLAEHRLAVRRHRATKRWGRVNLGELESQGILPVTIEGLIAYLGFTT